MFRTTIPRYFIPLFLLLILQGPGLSGQVLEHEVPELKQRAARYFQEGNYESAGAAYAQLIRQYPRDAMYRYYAGICNVERGRELETAVELLYFASTRGVPEDVYYYLGEAYRKMYDFERAKKYYITFDSEAPRSMARERDSKLLIRSVNSAMQLTSLYNPYEVQNVTFINLYDPAQAAQIRMKGGDLSMKPDIFFSEQENREDLNAWMFMPKNPVRGQKVYFSGLEGRGKGGFQVMQAERGSTGKWTGIQPLETLNTAGDEILPYFDPVGKDLYFASDGREGIGGFDLYRSHYDEERNEWSEPISLGFPVNSAFDDYLLLPGTDLGMVTFFSARQSNDTAVTVYRVHLSEPKQPLASRSPQEIRNIANLGDAASEMMKEYVAYRDFLAADREEAAASLQPTSSEALPGMGAGSAAQAGASAIPGRAPSGSVQSADPEYQALISAALKHQAASDSLTELSTAARIRVRESGDPNEKWLSQRQIMVWEKKSSEEQELADGFFSQVANYSKSAANSSDTIDTVITERTEYRLADSTPSGLKGPSGPDVEEKVKAVFSGTVQRGDEQSGALLPRKDEGPQTGKQRSEKDQQPAAGRDAGNEHSDGPLQNASGSEEGNVGSAGKFSGVADGMPGSEIDVPGSDNTMHQERIAATDQRFELLAASPYSVSNPIPVDDPLPQGTLYRIQLGVYSGTVDPEVYGGIVPINAMTDTKRNLVFYYAGNFQSYEAAMDALSVVREEGFADAFIVSWYNGAKMSVEKARKLE